MEYSNLVKVVGTEWADFLKPFMCPNEKGECPYDAIGNQLKEMYNLPKEQQPFPAKKNVFRCFTETPLSKVRVVLLGQDPYPKAGYANGLAFATDHTQFDEKNIIPPSLKKIYDVIDRDVYNGADPVKNDRNGILGHPHNPWTEQGVLLLNCALTVGMVQNKKGEWVGDPGSHENLWRPFTDFVVSNLWKVKRGLIFMAWGNKARNFTRYEVIKTDANDTSDVGGVRGVNVFQSFLLTAEHPAAAVHREVEIRKQDGKKDHVEPWVCDNFSRANVIIRTNGLGDPIQW